MLLWIEGVQGPIYMKSLAAWLAGSFVPVHAGDYTKRGRDDQSTMCDTTTDITRLLQLDRLVQPGERELPSGHGVEIEYGRHDLQGEALREVKFFPETVERIRR